MIIREATREDKQSIEELSVLTNASLRKVYRPTRQAIQHKATRKKLRTVLVCKTDGKLTGSVDYEKREDTLHIIGLGVHPDYQRRGIARMFIDHLINLTRRLNLSKLSLYTVKQTGNVPIFEKLGFEVIKEEPTDKATTESVTGEDLIDVYMERKIK